MNPSASSTVTQDAIKTALADGTPVVVAIPVYQNFYNVTSANDGLYDTVSGTLQGYHAVTALGYDAGGVRVENQWGTYWGDGGWATLSWAFVNQYVIEARAVLPMVAPDPSPKLISAPVVSGSLVRGATLPRPPAPTRTRPPATPTSGSATAPTSSARPARPTSPRR